MCSFFIDYLVKCLKLCKYTYNLHNQKHVEIILTQHKYKVSINT